MDFRKLKELAGKIGGLVIMDGEEPSFVILPYDKFKKIDATEEIPLSRTRIFGESNTADVISFEENQNEARPVNFDEAEVEKLNQEILALKEEIRQKEEAELVGNGQSAEKMAEVIDFD